MHAVEHRASRIWIGVACFSAALFANAASANAHPTIVALPLPTRLVLNPDIPPVIAVDARGDIAARLDQDKKIFVEWPSHGARIVFPKPKPAPSWPSAYYEFGALGPHGDVYAGITSWTEGAGFAHETTYYAYHDGIGRKLKFPCKNPALPEFVTVDGSIGMTQDFVTDFHSLDDPPLAPDAMLVRGSACIDLGPSFLSAARGRYIAGFTPVMSKAEHGQYLTALPNRAVRFTDLQAHDLGPGKALAVNAGGTCVGTSQEKHATAWYLDGRTKRLVSGDVSSAALAIGDDGRIAGTLVDAKSESYAFLAAPNGTAVKLDTLVGDPHWHLRSADAIMSDGSVVGIGVHDGALAIFVFRS